MTLREPARVTMDGQALLELMRTRRSVRRFRPDPLDPQTLAVLVEAARWAPSAGNRQAWRLLVVEPGPLLEAMGRAVTEEVERLRGSVRAELAPAAGRYLDNFLHFASAPLVLAPIWRAGAELFAAAGTHRGGEDALASVSAAVQNLLLAAHALGLGACWMTGPLVAEQTLQSLLAVPEGWRLAALIPVGWPAEEPAPPPRRDPGRLVQRLR